MRILLVSPLNDSHYKILRPDIGLGYLSTALKRHGHQVEIVDLELQVFKKKLTRANALDYLLTGDWDVIGFKAFNLDLPFTRQATAAIKAAHPNTVTVSGGPASLLYDQIFAYVPNLDYALIGEGEIAFPQLLDRLHDQEALSEVPGLLWKTPNGVRRNPPLFHEKLDEFEPVDWEALDPLAYPVDYSGDRLIPLSITRGCPYACNYCQASIISGKKIRARSPASVIAELRYLHQRFGITTFQVDDDNITAVHAIGLDFAEALESSGLKFRWRIPNGLRIDTLDVDLMKRFERTGCYYVYLAVESGSQRVLDLMNRKTRLDVMTAIIRQIAAETSIKMLGFFMLGYPGETVREAMATIKLACSLPLNRAAFFTFTPLPKTPIYEELDRQGQLQDYHMEKHFVLGASTSFSYPATTLKWLRRYAFLRFYTRPSVIASTIDDIGSWTQLQRWLSRAYGVVAEK